MSSYSPRELLRIKQGFCRLCGEPRIGGSKTYCKDCGAKRSEAQLIRYYRHKRKFESSVKTQSLSNSAQDTEVVPTGIDRSLTTE